MANTADLKSAADRLVGSSPTLGTIYKKMSAIFGLIILLLVLKFCWVFFEFIIKGSFFLFLIFIFILAFFASMVS
jgi:hypothetical protein